MSLSNSFRILRRCLNTAASDSKTISSVQPEAGSQSVNHGHTILERLADRANALHPALYSLVRVSIITGCIAIPIAYLVDESIIKAKVDNFKREAQENLEKKADEYWRGRVEELKSKEEEVDKEFKLAIQELKKERMEGRWF